MRTEGGKVIQEEKRMQTIDLGLVIEEEGKWQNERELRRKENGTKTRDIIQLIEKEGSGEIKQMEERKRNKVVRNFTVNHGRKWRCKKVEGRKARE